MPRTIPFLVGLLVAIAVAQDAGGYRVADSDSAGGPAFGWVDISSTGVPVPLDDDDNAGPFPLGFDFPFYRAPRSELRICSNGWLSFTSSSHQYHHFPIPDPRDPNALVAALWADLDPAAGGEVRYLAEPARFIVAWLGVPRHGTSEGFTFQAILDSTGDITFQYLDLPAGFDSASVGIEDDAGLVGTGYWRDGASGANRPHDSLAVRFYRLHRDVCPQALLQPYADVLAGDSIVPLVRVWNPGLGTATFGLSLRIGATYDEQMTVGGLAGLADSVIACPVWVPDAGGHAITAVTSLAGDEWGGNDTLRGTVDVDYAGWLRYDDGGADTTFVRNGAPSADWGAAVRFSIPWRGWAVEAARIFVADTLPFARVILCRDSAGLPGLGQALWSADSVRAVAPDTWLELAASAAGNENDDLWLVAFWPRRAAGPAIGEDRSVPPDGRSWYGSPAVRWLNYPTGDLMMRLRLQRLGGVEEGAGPAAPAAGTVTIVRQRLWLSPRPGGGPAAVALVDAGGRSVLQLRPGENDLSGVGPGVYFIRSETSATCKLLVLR